MSFISVRPASAVRLEAAVWFTDDKRFRVTKLGDAAGFEVVDSADDDTSVVGTMREVRAFIIAKVEGIQ